MVYYARTNFQLMHMKYHTLIVVIGLAVCAFCFTPQINAAATAIAASLETPNSELSNEWPKEVALAGKMSDGNQPKAKSRAETYQAQIASSRN